MYPRIKIGSYDFSTYWIVFACGIFLMFICNALRAGRKGRGRILVAGETLSMILASLVGAKLLYYLENFSVLLEQGVRLDGVSFFGAVFLAPLGAVLLSRIEKDDWRIFMDFHTPSLVIMLAVLRVGCFLSGCCGGKAVTFAGIYFSHFPTQLTECVGDIIILAGLFLYERYWDRTGRLYPFFLVYYGIIRFLLEFARDTPKHLLGMSNGQWFSIISVIAGGYLLTYFGKMDKKKSKYSKGKRRRVRHRP